ncbi:putative reverse transcriptase domain-containing protein [Tanacetum coccineum]
MTVSSPIEGLSDIGSSRVNGPPMMLEDPYAYMVAAFQASPSPDYVPSLEELEQAQPLPEFVPKLVYPEFMPLEDDVLPAEEHPLPGVASPTADSPGYISESDPKEDDDEDPEEDPANYPTDRDEEEEEEPSKDEADDKDEDEDDDEEEEEHPASVDSVPPPVYDVTARMSIREQPPTPFWSEAKSRYDSAESRDTIYFPSTTIEYTTIRKPHSLHITPLPTSSPPLLLPSTVCRAGVSETSGGFRADYGFVATLDDEIRRDPERDVGYGITDTWDEMLVGMPGAPATDDTELGRRMTNFVTTVRQDTDEIYERLDEAQDARAVLSGRSMDASDTAHSEVRALRTTVLAHQTEIAALRAADRARQAQLVEILRLMSVRRQAPLACECTYPDFMKCKPLYFKGTEGVVELTQWFERMETVFHISNYLVENQIKFATYTLLRSALTWWNSHVRTVGHDVAYAMTWTNLKKKMTDKMFPEESDKIEKYVGGLPDMIHGSVMASKPKTMQDAIEFATELMDKKISTLAERQAENKRKLDNNNQAQQQPPKKQGVAIAYASRFGERKEYVGTLPLCNKCKFHHNGQCTVKCANCKRVGHLTRDCRSPAATNNQRNLTCYECGNQGHYRSDCLELKNQNHENQAGGTRARGMVHALGGGETNQDLNGMDDDINA